VHHDTFDRLGNLFGAGIPINLEDALASSKLRPGSLVCLAGFSHAGDYGAAAVLRWQPTALSREQPAQRPPFIQSS
jgi:3-oxoacyl-[acyl-carrier-protein] synthase-3